MNARDFFKSTLGQEVPATYRSKLVLDPDDWRTIMFFTPYNKWSDPLSSNGRSFREKILPRAFSASVFEGGVYCLYEHNWEYILGRQNENFTISEGRDGLKCRLQLESTEFSMSLLDAVSAGELACSVGMSVTEERWPRSDERHVIAATLREISLVRRAAYPQTSSCFSRPPGQERRV